MYSRRSLLAISTRRGVVDVMLAAAEVAADTALEGRIAFETYAVMAEAMDELDTRLSLVSGKDHGQLWLKGLFDDER